MDAGLLIAGILTSAMGLYHFWLPTIFGWGKDLAKEPMLGWALLSINAFFSYLLLDGGAATIAISLRPSLRGRTAGGVLSGMMGFWLFNAAYQLVIPMPLPHRLAAMRWGFLAFAIVIVLLYAGALRRASVPPRTDPVAA
jgi:hypothetical protein